MTKRVLITGATGFAGRHLVRHLAESGYAVAGTSTHNENQEPHTYAVDLREFEEINRVVRDVRPTHVVHLAAISFIGHENVKQTYETNIVGSRNLLQALVELEARPASVLLTSSANVYGISQKGVLSESDPVNPVNDYAVSKVAMELMSRQFNRDLNIVIARPFNYTGRGQSEHFLIPKIVAHFRRKDEYIRLGNTDVSRDFSDIRTVVEYIKRLIESPKAVGNTYNICSGTPTSLKQIIKICENLSGHKIQILIDDEFKRENELRVLVGNPEKLRLEMGESQDHNIRSTLEWMLSE